MRPSSAATPTASPRPTRSCCPASAPSATPSPGCTKPASRRRLWHHLRSGKPFFGVCLGLQLLFTTSYEDGVHHGLDYFPGEVVRFKDVPGLKVPHMGWNQLRVRRPAPPLAGTAPDSSVYFVHSYYAAPKDETIIATETDYPTPFASAVWNDNVFATQFHPEKSQSVGLEMLRRFAEWK